jgi:hypothetical protein
MARLEEDAPLRAEKKSTNIFFDISPSPENCQNVAAIISRSDFFLVSCITFGT